jgi:HAMP domain-containing protein
MLAAGCFLVIYNMKGSISQLQAQGKESSIIGAKAVGSIIEHAIDLKILTKIDFFDSQFVPVKNTDPQEYETKFDKYLNGALSPLFNEYLQNKDIVYARAVDLNGYVPVKAIIDDEAEDPIIDAYGKQILLDDRTNKASLDDKKGLVQIYSDKNKIRITVFSSAIYFKGISLGSFFLGYKVYPASAFSTFFTPIHLIEYTLFLLILIVAIFLIVNLPLTPISKITQMTSSVADGNIDDTIYIAGKTDLCELAKTIDRLRISMKVASNRLARN